MHQPLLFFRAYPFLDSLFVLSVSDVGCATVSSCYNWTNFRCVFLVCVGFLLVTLYHDTIWNWCITNVECWGLLLRHRVLSFLTLFYISWSNTNKHVPSTSHSDRLQGQETREATVRGRTDPLTVNTVTLGGTEFVPIHLYLWDARQISLCIDFHQFIFALSLCFSFCLLLILHWSPHQPPLFSSLSLWPSFPLLLWRLSLALVVTVFISSILEGLRRDEIHSFVGGVKKKKGPVQYSTLSMVLWDP